MTLMLDFGTPELQENQCLLFEATKFVAICSSSPRKLTHSVSDGARVHTHDSLALSHLPVFLHSLLFSSVCTYLQVPYRSLCQ